MVHSAESLAKLGLWQQANGQLEAARISLERSLELQPRQAAAYYYLGQFHRYRDADRPRVELIERLAQDAAFSSLDRQLLVYTAGKAREELGEYEAAMAHFDEANRIISAQSPPFDAGVFVRGYDRFLELSPGPLEPGGPLDESPVFIVGMIRSGTTLLEQILSSHPAVASGGELPFWLQNVGQAVNFQTGTIYRVALRHLAERYVTLLKELGHGAARVTDKMPANASLLGLIRMSLPGARFIWIRRHGVDNCLSIYMTRFEEPPVYAGSKAGILTAYRQHVRIMEHWQALIPADRFISVSYEEFVSDPERVVRGLLDFCGLEWDEACLRHEGNPNTVTTPSLWRVRQAVDSRSVARWRRFRPWLGPFQELL